MNNELIKAGGCIEPPSKRKKVRFPILLIKVGVITGIIWVIIYLYTH